VPFRNRYQTDTKGPPVGFEDEIRSPAGPD
jgi:hypothetical protein